MCVFFVSLYVTSKKEKCPSARRKDTKKSGLTQVIGQIKSVVIEKCRQWHVGLDDMKRDGKSLTLYGHTLGRSATCPYCGRQESRGDGMQDALQQWIARRDGKQGQGHQKKHVQQGECRCPQSQDGIWWHEMGLELPPKLTQNRKYFFLFASISVSLCYSLIVSQLYESRPKTDVFYLFPSVSVATV